MLTYSKAQWRTVYVYADGVAATAAEAYAMRAEYLAAVQIVDTGAGTCYATSLPDQPGAGVIRAIIAHLRGEGFSAVKFERRGKLRTIRLA